MEPIQQKVATNEEIAKFLKEKPHLLITLSPENRNAIISGKVMWFFFEGPMQQKYYCRVGYALPLKVIQESVVCQGIAALDATVSMELLIKLKQNREVLQISYMNVGVTIDIAFEEWMKKTSEIQIPSPKTA